MFTHFCFLLTATALLGAAAVLLSAVWFGYNTHEVNLDSQICLMRDLLSSPMELPEMSSLDNAPLALNNFVDMNAAKICARRCPASSAEICFGHGGVRCQW